jgi:hypothetical protein
MTVLRYDGTARFLGAGLRSLVRSRRVSAAGSLSSKGGSPGADGHRDEKSTHAVSHPWSASTCRRLSAGAYQPQAVLIQRHLGSVSTEDR